MKFLLNWEKLYKKIQIKLEKGQYQKMICKDSEQGTHKVIITKYSLRLIKTGTSGMLQTSIYVSNRFNKNV